MKKLFTSIRQGKLDEVAAILDKKPELISCTAVAPPNENGLPVTAVLLRNLEEGRELLDGFHGLNPEKLKPFAVKYRGREHMVQPMPVEERRARYEVKWRELEPVLRVYYGKAL